MKELHQKQRNRQISGSIRSRHHQTNNNESEVRKDSIRRNDIYKYLKVLEVENIKK